MSRIWTGFVGLLVITLVSAGVGAGAQTPGGNAKARAIKNPVPATAASIKTGAQLYQKNCQFCHGPEGKGDGKLVPAGMKPANLTDADWIYGSTDGEIHEVIVNGLPEKKMPGVKGRINDPDVWHIVNYVRSLGPKTAAR